MWDRHHSHRGKLHPRTATCVHTFNDCSDLLYPVSRKERETEPNRPNRTEPSNFGTGRNRQRNQPRNRPRNRTRNRTRNQTEPNRWIWEKSGTETNRTEPVPSWTLVHPFSWAWQHGSWARQVARQRAPADKWGSNLGKRGAGVGLLQGKIPWRYLGYCYSSCSPLGAKVVYSSLSWHIQGFPDLSNYLFVHLRISFFKARWSYCGL